MDVAALTAVLGLPGAPVMAEVEAPADGPAGAGGREIVLTGGDLELRCPWLRPGKGVPGEWNGVTVVLPWYDVDSMFAAEPLEGTDHAADREPFPVADELLALGFGVAVVPWWAETLAAGTASRGLAERYGPAASAALADGWRTGLGRSLRDILAVVEILSSEPDDAGTLAVWGHSLGGKLALFTAAVDPRVQACVTHELGFGWAHSNWWDPWYFGEVRPEFDCDAVLGLVAPRPVLYGAGHGFDQDEGLALVRSVQLDGWRADVLEHRAGHRPPSEVRQQTYEWLRAQLAD